ncbi:MAG TPA: IclR family transcriptional regulator [Steroidobacteraceae bacterium]|jgi:DNA-binding IclR family transcriptional regulator|nr:IclR family transcriptional regulator [Steroidobacteraceae bacterium]
MRSGRFIGRLEFPADAPGGESRVPLGSQTLLRGLDVIDVVAQGPIKLADLAVKLGLTRSTTHRLASALTVRRYLTFVPHSGYSLGPKLLELGFRVRDDLDLPRVAAPHLERLALLTEDTVHLGVLERDHVLYLDKIPGKRRINIISRIGEMQPVTSTGLGKALVLDLDEGAWSELFRSERRSRRLEISQQEWLERMRGYAQTGYAFDLEENEEQIRCIAAPVRDVAGRTVAAISISSAAQYMSVNRMHKLSKDVVETARRISQDLGWVGRHPAATGAAARPARAAPRGRARGRDRRTGLKQG